MTDVQAPYQVLPPLAGEEFAALKAAVLDWGGVRDPVVVTPEGEVLDGHHRIRAWTELVAEGHALPPYPTVCRDGLASEVERRAEARSLNLRKGRQLGREAKQAIVDDQLRDTPGTRDTPLARQLGVSQQLVAARRAVLRARGEIDPRFCQVQTDLSVLDRTAAGAGDAGPAPALPAQPHRATFEGTFVCSYCGMVDVGACWHCVRCQRHSPVGRLECDGCGAPAATWTETPNGADAIPAAEPPEHADMTIGDLLRAGVALPPFPSLPEEVTAFNQVVYAARVARLDPHAVAREVGPRGHIQTDGLLRLARWIETLVRALNAQPRLRTLHQDAEEEDR